MTNAELIKALRYCVVHPFRPCDGCVLFETDGCINVLHGDAADALEAAEQRIANQQKQIAKLDILLDSKIEELEAQFLKEGEWKWNSLLNEYEWVDKTFYCPNCGARMKKGEEK